MREGSAVLDIGSSSIIALVGENGVNGTLKILGKGSSTYAGFQNAEFLEPENLKFAIATAIANAEETAEVKITSIFIGVPAEFSCCLTKTINLDFPKQKKISKFDIDNIYKTGEDFSDEPEYQLFNRSVIYYEVDGARRVIDPIGLKAKRLTGKISYMLGKHYFFQMICSIFAELKISIWGFISSPLADCLYLFEPEKRDRYVLLVDVGYITTSVSLSRGNALLFMNSFSLGGGYVTSDLSECLKISFTEAERLKHKVILGWEATNDDTYEIDGDEYKLSYSAKAANEIVSDRVEMICEYITKCLERCEYDIPDFIPIYLVGGGLNYISGIKVVMSKKLGRKVELVSKIGSTSIRPHDVSAESLLDFTLNYDYLFNNVLVKV